ncbi:MAG: hypothetical protein R3E13_10015 [Alphaproteobacteria bacterium]
MSAPNIASHWVQVNGGTGDVMNQKVVDAGRVVLDTALQSDGADINPDLTIKPIV